MQSEVVIISLNKSLTSEPSDTAFNEFTARVQTYIDDQKWIKKPSALSPTICAQYGWKCIKSDLLECVTCGAKLSVYEPKIGNYDAYKACLEKTLSSLKENHGKHCPWPLTPSPENFVKMIPMPKEEALLQYAKRVELSTPSHFALPKIKEDVYEDLGFDRRQMISLGKIAGIENEEVAQYGKSIIPFCITGWIITEDKESKACILKCNNCLRSLWSGSFRLFKSNDSQSIESNEAGIPDFNVCNDQENIDELPRKRKRVSFVIKQGEPFDPIHEHRPWCLWIHDGVDSYTPTPNDNKSDEAVKNTATTPGYKIFIKSLLRNINGNRNQPNYFQSPSRERLRNVKSMLEKWTDAI